VSRRSAFPAAALLLVAALAAVGCGTAGLEKRRQAYRQFYAGDVEPALAALEKAENRKDRLLFALDRGLIAHTLGRPEESNRAFAEAEEILAAVDVTDLSDEAASFLINDSRIEYKGETSRRF